MLSYCLKCREKQAVKIRGLQRKKGKLKISSKWSLCDLKNSRFIKEREASWLFWSLTPSSKIPLVCSTLFKTYKMIYIVNNYLLVVDKFISEMHWRPPGFTYSVCEPFTKNKEWMQKFKEAGNLTYISQKELDKA